MKYKITHKIWMPRASFRRENGIHRGLVTAPRLNFLCHSWPRRKPRMAREVSQKLALVPQKKISACKTNRQRLATIGSHGMALNCLFNLLILLPPVLKLAENFISRNGILYEYNAPSIAYSRD